MTAVQVVTLVATLVGMIIGIGGFALALTNYRHKIRYSASRLRVIPTLAFPGPVDEMIAETYFDDGIGWWIPIVGQF